MADTSIETTLPDEATRASEPPRSVRRKRDMFYVSFSAAMLILVFLGFTPTFFLNPIMAKLTYGPHVVVHGVVGATWYVLALIQSLLIAQRRVAIHRALGIVTAATGLVAGASIVIAAILVFPGIVEEGGDPEVVMRMGRRAQMARDILAAFPFLVFLGLGIVLRGKPQSHKRLMMFASIALSMAAISRLLFWIGMRSVPPPWPALAVLVVLVGAIAIYDLVALRRVHPVTAISAPLCIFAFLLIGAVVPRML